MKIGVVGLGLIGGSIYKDLVKLGYDVVGVSQSQTGVNISKSYEILSDCDVVFVCSAMNKTPAILDELEDFLNENIIVCDVCSLKEFVCHKSYKYKFVPTHPMAGTENKGFDSSFEGLFKNAKWAICPQENRIEDIDLIKNLIEQLGAKPMVTSPKEHDVAVAMISHMPMVIAQALFYAAKDNQLALELAASGFRDMTRLALSNEEMACDMVAMNSANIEQAILKLYKAVGDLTKGAYPELISEIKKQRSEMFR